MRIIVAFFAMSLAAKAMGQDSTSMEPKVRYYFSFTSGMMTGDKARSITYTATTAHGVTVGHNLRIAGGIGIDSYTEWQTMPVFAQVSYDVLQRKNTLFVQVSYGWSHAWMQRSESYYNVTETGGRIFSAMLGYRLAEGNVRIYVAAGYKAQLTSARYESPVDPASSVPFYFYRYSEKVDYMLERMVLTIGVGWR